MTQDKDLVFAQRTFFCFSATAQVAHLVLPDTQRQRFTKPKEPIFSNALSTAFQTLLTLPPNEVFYSHIQHLHFGIVNNAV
ncbi:MAG: hypothetical protein IPK11_03030 [Ignavibacteria bacterium]|nr:hypothetical protein [Ignavibacteria bacterium]